MTLDDLIGESNALEIFVCRFIMNAYAVSPRRDMTAEYLVLGRYAIASREYMRTFSSHAELDAFRAANGPGLFGREAMGGR